MSEDGKRMDGSPRRASTRGRGWRQHRSHIKNYDARLRALFGASRDATRFYFPLQRRRNLGAAATVPRFDFSEAFHAFAPVNTSPDASLYFF
eukprot:8781-Pelagococcus_subviridis.AAC.1